jgi:hypothetical protein
MHVPKIRINQAHLVIWIYLYRLQIKLAKITLHLGSQDSSVGIATRYGLDSPRSNAGGGETFRTRPDRPWGLPSLLYNGYRVFRWGKAAGTWCWPPHPHLQCRGLKKGRAIPLHTLRGLATYKGGNFTFYVKSVGYKNLYVDVFNL